MHFFIRRVALLLAFLVPTLYGCAALKDPFGHRDALELAQKQYTDAIRWGRLEMAIGYVDPERRNTFENLMPAFEEIRISDYEIGAFDSTSGEATVTVTYRGYALSSQIEKRVLEHQEWKRGKGLGNVWHVQSDIDEVVDSLLDPSS